MYSLQVLGPVRRFIHGHEAAVGQDGAHDEQAEQSDKVKEEPGPKDKTQEPGLVWLDPKTKHKRHEKTNTLTSN